MNRVISTVAALGLVAATACEKTDQDQVAGKTAEAVADVRQDASALAKDAGATVKAGAADVKAVAVPLVRDAGATLKKGAAQVKEGAKEMGSGLRETGASLKASVTPVEKDKRP